MKESYRILYQGGFGELIEKKSRFLATLKPVEAEAEAIALIEEIKKKYWDASHNCFAYILGHQGQLMRCSDDGEPSQTAGRPMLDVLSSAGICNVCAVVTRYFGGTLLGTGGLVRAYSGAVQEGLKNCVILEKRLGRQLKITTDYTRIGKLQYLAAQAAVSTIDTQYTDQVKTTLIVPKEVLEPFLSQVTEKTGGQATILQDKWLYYGFLDGELILFDH